MGLGAHAGSWEEEWGGEQVLTSPDLVVMGSMSGISSCPGWWAGSHMLITYNPTSRVIITIKFVINFL